MARLSVIGSSLLRLESETAHMHIGWSSILELPAGSERLSLDRLIERIAGRLHLLPRLRQVVRPVRLGLTEPVWRDDPDFDLRHHVHELPRVDGERALTRATDAFLAGPLRRDRPLWELALVSGLPHRRAAVLGKIHHAMLDGVAATQLGTLLFDLRPEAETSVPPAWSPASSDARGRLVLNAVTATALEPLRATRHVVRLSRSPIRAARVARTLPRAALSLAHDALRPAPPCYLNVAIGPTRTLVTHRVDLGRLLALEGGYAVTLNDIVLATCAGALRRFAIARGEPPIDLRVMVPVSRRQPAEAAAGAGAVDQITFGFVELPISSARVPDRLERVVRALQELERDGLLASASTLLSVTGVLPDLLKDRVARVVADPRLYNLVVSNLPGPSETLYACGARVLSIHPVIPIPDRYALSIGVLTYDHAVHFSCYADPRALGRVAPLAIALEDSIVELESGAQWAKRMRERKWRGRGGRTRAGRGIARAGASGPDRPPRLAR